MPIALVGFYSQPTRDTTKRRFYRCRSVQWDQRQSRADCHDASLPLADRDKTDPRSDRVERIRWFGNTGKATDLDERCRHLPLIGDDLLLHLIGQQLKPFVCRPADTEHDEHFFCDRPRVASSNHPMTLAIFLQPPKQSARHQPSKRQDQRLKPSRRIADRFDTPIDRGSVISVRQVRFCERKTGVKRFH